MWYCRKFYLIQKDRTSKLVGLTVAIPASRSPPLRWRFDRHVRHLYEGPGGRAPGGISLCLAPIGIAAVKKMESRPVDSGNATSTIQNACSVVKMQFRIRPGN